MSDVNWQEECVRSWVVNEDLRRRAAELSNALQEEAPKTWESLTPMRFTAPRSRLLLTLVETVEKWRAGQGSTDDIAEAVDALTDYLPYWQQELQKKREEGQRRQVAKARAAKGAN